MIFIYSSFADFFDFNSEFIIISFISTFSRLILFKTIVEEMFQCFQEMLNQGPSSVKNSLYICLYVFYKKFPACLSRMSELNGTCFFDPYLLDSQCTVTIIILMECLSFR